MFEIDIINRKPEMERIKKDRVVYYEMVDCLREKINNAGLHMTWIDCRKNRKKTDINDLEISVKITPSGIDDSDPISKLYIEVHKEGALSIVKDILKSYQMKYHNLTKVDISTYF